MNDAAQLGAPRWRGERGRVEAWYLSFTDPASGWAGWIHGETVAPTSRRTDPYAHGWTVLFPPHRPPVLERFGPDPVAAGDRTPWFSTDAVEIGPLGWTGATSTLSWELTVTDESDPLYTFPRSVWERRRLRAAQIVPQPDARVTGTVTAAGTTVPVDAAGSTARSYRRGSPLRWGWLYAALGEGGVLEVVTASGRWRGRRRRRPVAMVQVRLPGERDWPFDPAQARRWFRTHLRADGFRVIGSARRHRLDVDVTFRSHQAVILTLTDPDGSSATCTHSGLASATVEYRVDDRTWHWDLEHTAHAEIGSRP